MKKTLYITIICAGLIQSCGSEKKTPGDLENQRNATTHQENRMDPVITDTTGKNSNERPNSTGSSGNFNSTTRENNF